MKLIAATSLSFVLALSASAPLLAQTTSQTKVANSTSMKDGVATDKTTVTHTTKHTTHRPRKILGVKVGHQTETHKTVKTTKTSTNGDKTTTVKTSN